MTSIELTDEQRRVLLAEHGKPVDVVDPATQQRYVLLVRDQYERIRALLEQGTGAQASDAFADIPPGILRSQQAFWRDLPELLKAKRNHGKYVCYHGEERIGIGDYQQLIRECLRRGIPGHAYHLDVIEPHALPPWEPEEVEPLGPQHLDEYVQES